MPFFHPARQQRLLLDLYEEAIEGVRRAKSAFETMRAHAVSQFHSHLVHSQQVMHQLTASLDIRSGGEPAAQLMRLYDRINYQLICANVMEKREGLDEAIDLLIRLRDRLAQEVQPSELTSEEELVPALLLKGGEGPSHQRPFEGGSRS